MRREVGFCATAMSSWYIHLKWSKQAQRLKDCSHVHPRVFPTLALSELQSRMGGGWVGGRENSKLQGRKQEQLNPTSKSDLRKGHSLLDLKSGTGNHDISLLRSKTLSFVSSKDRIAQTIYNLLRWFRHWSKQTNRWAGKGANMAVNSEPICG